MTGTYTIYSTYTGRVLRHMTCPPELIELNVQAGQAFVEGIVDAETQMIVDGVAVPLPEHVFHAERIERETNNVKSQRNALLAACDWTQVPDAPVDSAAWAIYRQALRDIPDQPGFPLEVIWPTPPT